MTTATGAEDEKPWGFERESEAPQPEAEKWHEARVTVKAGDLFRGDGMMWALLRKIGLAMGMVSQADRGPQDYVESDFERGVRAGARHGGYREAPKGDGNLKAVIIGCTIVLVSGGIIGAITFSNQFSEFRGQVLQWQKSMEAQQSQVEMRLDRLENRRQ